MGFTKTANLTHEMENVLHLVRSKEIEVSDQIVDILFECFDTLEEYINHLSNTGEEGDLDSTELVNKLKAVEKNRGFGGPALDETVVEESSSSSVAEAGSSSDDEFHLDVNDLPGNIIENALSNGFNALKVKIILNEGCMLKSCSCIYCF